MLLPSLRSLGVFSVSRNGYPALDSRWRTPFRQVFLGQNRLQRFGNKSRCRRGCAPTRMANSKTKKNQPGASQQKNFFSPPINSVAGGVVCDGPNGCSPSNGKPGPTLIAVRPTPGFTPLLFEALIIGSLDMNVTQGAFGWPNHFRLPIATGPGEKKCHCTPMLMVSSVGFFLFCCFQRSLLALQIPRHLQSMGRSRTEPFKGCAAKSPDEFNRPLLWHMGPAFKG